MIKHDEKSKRGRMGVLFVCTGNICRSPMAEVIFSNLLKNNGRDDVIVAGAGTQASASDLMTGEAKEALKICGERVPRHTMRATPFSHFMYGEFDYIICMTQAQVEYLGRQHQNVFSLDEWTGCGDIFDPYLYPIDMYINVCRKLQEALKVLYNKIIKKEEK